MQKTATADTRNRHGVFSLYFFTRKNYMSYNEKKIERKLEECPDMFGGVHLLLIFFFQPKGILMDRRMYKYGCGAFIFDIFMIAITGGLWLIWIFVREMRNR